MRQFIARAVISGVGLLFVSSALFRETIIIDGLVAAILAVGVIGIANALVRPVLFVVKIVTFPMNLVTLGLFGLLVSWAVNALIFLVVGNLGFISGFEVRGILPAILGSLALSIINGIATMLVGGEKKDEE
jgi:putative membrane protein